MNSLQSPETEDAGILTTDQLKSAWLSAQPIQFGDPALAHASFSFRQTFFPFGFPVTVSTNSSAVLDAAVDCWGSFEKIFDIEPFRINIGVTPSDSLECPPPPRSRIRDHLTMSIADGENLAICDNSLDYALVWVNTAAVRHLDYFRYFFLECIVMCCIVARHTTGIHAGCVSLDGAGILLCGDSGTGKSTLSRACARAGWTYITDDGAFLVHDRTDRLVVGNSSRMRFRPSAQALFPELHGCDVMQRAGVGKPSIEWATAADPGIVTSGTAIVRHIVFLNRTARTRELAAFPTAVARLFMLQQVYCSMPYLEQLHSEAIDNLLRVGVYELRYDDLGWAVDRLRLLALENE